MKNVLIVNPIAGNGYALSVVENIEKILREESDCEYCVLKSERPGHAEELARAAASDPETAVVFAVGGDGTVSEVSRGLAGTGKPFGIIPAGTGNDFIKSVGIPKDPADALRFALTHEPRNVDSGFLNDGFFLNVCGTGFDVTVLDYAESYKSRYRGLTPYLLGLLKAISHYRAVHLAVTVDGKREEGEYLVCSVANGRYIGGGIPICPAARTDDGRLDVVLIRNVSRWRIPFYLPGLMLGRDLHFRVTRHMLADQVVLEAENMRVNVDGEILSMRKAAFSLNRGALRLICP